MWFQAWCKFYECVNKFPIVPQYAINLNIVNTLHICEAPGGFICSLNHYLKSNFPAVQVKITLSLTIFLYLTFS